jgi:hypothetical protein
MKEQFDKQLVEKIKDSFEKHQEPYDPANWDKLAATYFATKKGFIIAPWIYWAAGIALLVGLSIVLINSSNELGQADQKPIAQNIQVEEPLLNEEKEGQESIIPLEDSKEDLEALNIISIPESGLLTKNNSYPDTDAIIDNIAVAETTGKEEITIPEIEDPKEVLSIKENRLELAINLKNEEEEKAIAIIESWLNEVGESSEMDKLKENDSQASPVKLGVMVIPQAANSSNQSINLGGGLISEFSFSKRIKLDVGMAYASQNLNPANSNMFFASTLDQAEDASLRSSSMSTNIINSASELRFGQLEIPVNLKYKVLENNKSGFYLLSGLSNMFYLNQRNVNTFESVNFNMAGLVTSQNVVESFSETIRPSDVSANATMGQMINFGLGYEHNLNNGTFFSVEPFYKTSLGGQTFWGQQFSIGGINLRMNFQLKNK